MIFWTPYNVLFLYFFTQKNESYYLVYQQMFTVQCLPKNIKILVGIIVLGRFSRVLKVRLDKVWIKECPAGLEPPAGAKNKKKIT